jgi:hypothetical protein
MTNAVDEFYANYIELVNLIPSRNLSLQNWAHENFRRVLVLAMANYLENEITNLLKEFSRTKSGNEPLRSFVRNKAIERQYHTYFDWKGHNANRFFSLFGKDFAEQASSEVKQYPALDEAIKAFLEIGKTRNTLIHENLHVVDIGNKTAKEFYDLFNKSLNFITFMKRNLVYDLPLACV